MSSATHDCRLCWPEDSKTNPKLTYGKTLSVGQFLYTHYYTAPDGAILKGIMATKGHYPSWEPLPPEWAEESNRLDRELRDRLGCKAMNRSQNAGREGNDGHVAGERQYGHWHMHFEPRFPDRPSSNMGIGLMITQFDTLVHDLEKLAENSGPDTAAQIRQLIHKTKVE
jgi:diadenosine tetraphosphate (Ap4A) HIT family hydrolase